MNREQFEKKLNEELAALKEEMMKKFEEEHKNEFPKLGDNYWCIGENGTVRLDMWDNHYTDEARFAFGNVFKTEREADFALERLSRNSG